MKTRYHLLLIACFVSVSFISSCKKGSIPSNGNEIIIPPGDTTQPVVLYSGVLIGGEMGDRARGDVTIEKVGTKKYLVFSNFASNNGPDVHVYLSKTIGSNAVPPTDYRDLGLLKYTSGTFNYELLTDPDLSVYKYVLVWCVQYRIQFGYTELK